MRSTKYFLLDFCGQSSEKDARFLSVKVVPNLKILISTVLHHSDPT